MKTGRLARIIRTTLGTAIHLAGAAVLVQHTLSLPQ